jgi:hydrogenase maturation protein HypF
MSISRSGGAETHVFRIQMKEGSDHSSEWVNAIAREMDLQGRGAIEGRVIYIMLNARAFEIEDLLEKLLSTINRSSGASLLSRERLPFVHLAGFSMLRGSSALPLRERHATEGDNMCPDCRGELKDPDDRRFGYPFTECPVCAPSFHDRNVRVSPDTLKDLTCHQCRDEALDPTSRRYLFADITCPECGPSLFWQRRGEARWEQSSGESIMEVIALLKEGGIVAIKGTGGYHLACDASNERSIRDLRKRKGNRLKPLAVMFPGLSEAAMEVDINEQQAAALLSSTGSIVICPFRSHGEPPRIARTSLSGILDRQGIMLPHSPLMQVIASMFDGPLVVTSANRSGDPLIHRAETRTDLWDFADAIIDHDRRITRPREEPVIQFTEAGERILLRSTHSALTGLSVDWHNSSLGHAMAISMSPRLTIGSIRDGIYKILHSSVDNDWMHLIPDSGGLSNEGEDPEGTAPGLIIMEQVAKDQSDNYLTRMNRWPDIPQVNAWHHEAHFASVLSEHGLLQTDESILGIVWDRGGYGTDGHQWGSEFMIRKDGQMHPFAAFEELPHTEADPGRSGHRIAALGLLRHRLDARRLIGHLFSQEEWPRYERWAMRKTNATTRSMSHIIDGVAAILGLTNGRYEGGEMDGLPLIETIARRIQMEVSLPYELHLRNGKVDWRSMIDTIIGDIDSGAGREMIARRFLASLASLIATVTTEAGVKKVALSGDVFTSPLLVGMISEQLGRDTSLYIHQYLAPTDECINLGQLALWADAKRRGESFGTDVRTSVKDRSERSEQ